MRKLWVLIVLGFLLLLGLLTFNSTGLAQSNFEPQVSVEKRDWYQTDSHRPEQLPYEQMPINLRGGNFALPSSSVLFPDVLTVTKRVSTPIVAGMPLTYFLTITNTSSVSNATNILITDTVPVDAVFASANDSGSLVVNDVNWTISSLAASSDTTVSFVATTCQTSLTNSHYRAVSSDQGFFSQLGEPLVTAVSSPSIVADFIASPSPVTIGEAASFTDNSTTNGGILTNFVWDFGDASNGNGSSTSHIYTATGSYTVTLAVADVCGFSHSVDKVIDVVAPNLTINKIATPNPVPAGDRLSYTIIVENIGAGNASGVLVSDVLPANTTFVADSINLDPPTGGTVGTNLPILVANASVAAGQKMTVTYAVDVTMPLTNGVTITNTASVTSNQTPTPAIATNITTVSATPHVSADKTGASQVNYGETIIYTINVTNAGNTLLRDLIVVDDMAGPATLVDNKDGDPWLGLTETWVYSVAVSTTSGSVPDPIADAVQVSAKDSLGITSNTSDTHITDILHIPVLSISKTGPTTAIVGEVISYTISVSNNGVGSDGSDVFTVTVSDPMFGADLILDGGDDGDDILETGETWVYTETYTVQNSDPNSLDNIATVSGFDSDGDAVGPVIAGHSVDVAFSPALLVSKDGPTSANVGQQMQYTIIITNDGSGGDGSPISNVIVADSTVSAGSPTKFGGDTDDLLEANEYWVYSPMYTPPPTAQEAITNTVIVNGDDNDSEAVTQVGDFHRMAVLHNPVITVTKTGSTSALVGDVLNFNFDVSHDATSDGSPVTILSVVDTLAGTAIYDSGDTNSNSELDQTETWRYLAGYTVLATDTSPLENVVTVIGTDFEGDTKMATSATHQTNIDYQPELGISMSSAKSVANVGELVTYTVIISNDNSSGDGSAIQAVSLNTTYGTNVQDSNGDGDAFLEVGEQWQYTVSYMVTATDPDPLNNIATADGDDGNSESVADATANHAIGINFAPDLLISKDGPATGNVGQQIQYTIIITNDNSAGDGSDISNVVVTDPLATVGSPTKIGGNLDPFLEVGERWVYVATYTIPPTAPSSLSNTATVNGQDRDGGSVSKQDSHSLEVEYSPVLTITKNGPSTANVGEMVTFSFAVRHAGNSDDSPVSAVSVNDDIAGEATKMSGDNVPLNSLDQGEVWAYEVTYVIPVTATDPLFNRGQVLGNDGDSETLSAISGRHEIQVSYAPALSISVSGPNSEAVGNTVNYTVNVENDTINGDGSPIQNVTLSATHQDSITLNSSGNGNSRLELGEVWQYTVSYQIQPDDPNSLVNLFTVDGDDLDFDDVADQSDSHTLDVQYNPALKVLKNGPATASVGSLVNYFFIVTNDQAAGDGSPIKNVTINDNIIGAPTIINNGDGDGFLEMGETWTYWTQPLYQVPATASDPLVNTVTVNGQDLDNQALPTAMASHSMNINFDPSISININAVSSASVGDTINYTYEVETGGDNSSLSGVGVNDSIPGSPTFSGGDTNSNSKIDNGETWTYTAQYTVSPNDASPVSNLVSVTALDGDSSPVNENATHFTNIQYAPRLRLTKSGQGTAEVDETVTYVFIVEHNPSTSDRSDIGNISVTDNIAGAATYISGDTSPNNGLLDFGEQWRYEAAYKIKITDNDPLINQGTVSGQDLNSVSIPTASDTHSTNIDFRPALSINTSGPAVASPNQSIDFIFTIQNDSNAGDGSPISAVNVTDSLGTSVTLVSKLNGDNDNLLESGETWTYTGTYIVQPAGPNPLINIGTVTGNDKDGVAVPADMDDHQIPITFTPVMEVSKSGPSQVSLNEEIVYTIAIEHSNTSDNSPINTVVVDDLLTTNETYISGDTNNNQLLESGETWTYVTTYTTVFGDLDPLINTVMVDGKNAENFDIDTASDNHSADIDHKPEMILDVNVSESGSVTVGQTVIYSYVVRYDGTGGTGGDGSPISNVVINDSLADTIDWSNQGDGDALLEPGETWIYNVSHTVTPADPDPLANNVRLNGQDQDGQAVAQKSENSNLDVEFIPVLAVTKTGPATANVSDVVVYRFTVSHAAASDNSSVNTVLITDTLFGPATFVPGTDTNSNSQLDAGEVWEYIIQHTIVVNDSDPLVNFGIVTGLDRDGDGINLNSTSHSLDIDFRPQIQITTIAPLASNVGQTIAFSYSVEHNPSTTDHSPMSNVSVTNDTNGTAGSGTYVSGDTNSNNLLDSGEDWLFNMLYIVPNGSPNPFAHEGRVSGVDADGQPIPTDSDSRDVALDAAPTLNITKSGQPEANAGDLITYNLEVTNSGLVQANNVVITDRVASGVAYISGGTLIDGVVEWYLPVLAPLTTEVVSFTVKALSDTVNNDYGVRADGEIYKMGSSPASTSVTHFAYIPTLEKPLPPTTLFITNDNTGGNVQIIVYKLGDIPANSLASCIVPNNSTLLCGTFPAGTYNVQLTSACGGGSTVTVERSFPPGSDTRTVSCG